jgi:hypothetical protein
MIPAPVCAAVTARVSNRVMVTGRLRQRSWETPEGDKRSVTELEADEVGASLKWATAKLERLASATTANGLTPQPPDSSLVVLKEVRRTLAEGTWHLLALGTPKALLDRVEQRLWCRSGQQAGWAWCSSMRWTTPPWTRRV